MWQCVFRHMWTAKAQIRLHGCAVWSGPSLSANRIIGYYRTYEWRAKALMILCTCAGWSESVHFVLLKTLFSLILPIYSRLSLSQTPRYQNFQFEITAVWDNRSWNVKNIKQNSTNIIQKLVWLKQQFELSAMRVNCIDMVNVLKFPTPKFLTKCYICKQCRPRSDCSWRSSLIRVFTVCHSIKHFKRQMHKKQNLRQKSMEESVRNFRTFTVQLFYLQGFYWQLCL